MDQLNSNPITPERKRGKHLNFEDRCGIRIFKKLGYSLRTTAEAIGCAASTVLNELRRGTGIRNGSKGRSPEYSAKRGQSNYEINRSRCHKPHKIDPNSDFIRWVVRMFTDEKWSLDNCVGYARKYKLFPDEEIVCAKTLYNEEYGDEKFAEVFKTITSDNGSEFARLSEIEAWGVKVYFAHAYSSWERGQNERHNRMLRKYVPKGVSITKYTEEEILGFADKMNDVPRRILGYSTPNELFERFLDQVYSVIKEQPA